MNMLDALGKFAEESVHEVLGKVFIIYTLVAFVSVWYMMLTDAQWLFVILAGLNFAQSLLVIFFYEKSLK